MTLLSVSRFRLQLLNYNIINVVDDEGILCKQLASTLICLVGCLLVAASLTL
jgi:hypothetical protein